MLQFIFLLLSLSTPPQSAKSRMAGYCEDYTYGSFFALSKVNEKINLKAPDTVLMAAAVFHATNETRVKRKLSQLAYNENLSEAAASQGADMYINDYFGHENPRKKKSLSVEKRMKSFEPELELWGENIIQAFSLKYKDRAAYQPVEGEDGSFRYLDAQNKDLPVETYASLARKCVKSWLESPGHRENLLDKNFKVLGTGVYFFPDPYTTDVLPKLHAVQCFGSL